MIRIGTSGWRYPEWRGDFYPKGLPQRRELEVASRAFDTIEINGSFYSLLQPPAVRRWRAETPDDFVFAVKGSRYITHMKKLRGVETALANFFASGLLALGEKLGPILWQLPPQTHYEPDVLARFFDLLPRTTSAASRLARRHDGRVRPRAHLKAVAKMPIRYALEIRHTSFETPKFLDLLRAHDIAVTIADTAGLYPCIEEVTSSLAYVRLHGDTELYASGYRPAALRRWAKKIIAWSARADVFVYFDNDAMGVTTERGRLVLSRGGRAPHDARALADLVHQRS